MISHWEQDTISDICQKAVTWQRVFFMYTKTAITEHETLKLSVLTSTEGPDLWPIYHCNHIALYCEKSQWGDRSSLVTWLALQNISKQKQRRAAEVCSWLTEWQDVAAINHCMREAEGVLLFFFVCRSHMWPGLCKFAQRCQLECQQCSRSVWSEGCCWMWWRMRTGQQTWDNTPVIFSK